MSPIEDLVEAARGGGISPRVNLRLEVGRMLGAGQAGRREIDRFLRKATPRDWITLDEAMRAYWYGLDEARPWWRRAWLAIRNRTTESSDALAVGLASMDRDGRTREAAVRRLQTESDSLVGPFLALRTVDWVEEVAAAAVMTLTERLLSQRSVLVAAAPLLFALKDRRRGSGIDAIVLDRAAVDPVVRASLLTSADTATRRRTIHDRRVREAEALDGLVKLAREDPDTIVASAAGVEAVSRISTPGADDAVLHTLLTGPALVRRAVLDELAGSDRGFASGERHLFDRSPAVRSAAQRAFRAGGGDPAAAYRAALDAGRHAPIAVRELALIGSGSDRDAVVRALQSPDVSTRRAAVNAARWLPGEQLAPTITPMLWDTSAGVTRAVERRLRSKARDLDGEMLIAASSAPGVHNRRAAYRLMRRRSAPERVEADLMALSDEDDLVRRDSLADVRSWLHRGAASAPRSDLPTRRRLSKRLDEVEGRLSQNDVKAIRFHAGLRPEDLNA